MNPDKKFITPILLASFVVSGCGGGGVAESAKTGARNVSNRVTNTARGAILGAEQAVKDQNYLQLRSPVTGRIPDKIFGFGGKVIGNLSCIATNIDMFSPEVPPSCFSR